MSLACALALPALASLVTLVSAEAQLDLDAASRTSTVAVEHASPYAREALLARPGAAVRLDEEPLRLTGTYAATIWTSDVEARPSPLVTHDAQITLESHHASPWHAAASASAARGWTDPLADPVNALASPAGLSQSPSLAPLEFEALRAGFDASWRLDPRSTVTAAGSASRSAAVHEVDRAVLPPQDGATADVGWGYRLSRRNTLQLAIAGTATRTRSAAGTDDSGWARSSAALRLRLARVVEGWAGAGVLVTRHDAPDLPSRRGATGTGEMGVAYETDRTRAQLSAQAIPFTDRYTGDVAVMYQASGALRWRASERVALTADASAGALRSGVTALASLDARGTYAVHETLALEAGIAGRWQHERRVEYPSFRELGVVVGLRWASGPAPAAPAAAPDPT